MTLHLIKTNIPREMRLKLSHVGINRPSKVALPESTTLGCRCPMPCRDGHNREAFDLVGFSSASKFKGGRPTLQAEISTRFLKLPAAIATHSDPFPGIMPAVKTLRNEKMMLDGHSWQRMPSKFVIPQHFCS
jgi:hypothetical protein